MDIKKLMEEMRRAKELIDSNPVNEARRAMEEIKSRHAIGYESALQQRSREIKEKASLYNETAAERLLRNFPNLNSGIANVFQTHFAQQRQEIVERLQGKSAPSYILEQMQEELRKHREPMDNAVTRRYKELLDTTNRNYEDATHSHRQIVLTPSVYKPEPMPDFEPRNFAAEWIEGFGENLEKRKQDLPEDKTIRVYVEFGSKEILVAEFIAVDSRIIEIKGFDGESLVSLNCDYSQIKLLFQIVDVPQIKPSDSIH